MKHILSAVATCALIALSLTRTSGQQGWSQIQTIKQQLNAIFYNGDQLWIVGAHGLILRSEDEGRTFTQLDSKVDVGLNDVFVRGSRVLVVGDEGTILFSRDRGRRLVKNLYTAHRKSTSSAPLDLYSIQFVNSDRGYIVGDNGLILTSDDGGISWQQQPSGTNAQLFHLSFRQQHGWVVGTGGTILHTDDGGKNWYPQRSGVSEDLNRVMMITDKVGLITGDKGIMLRTENGGATWQRVRLRSATYNTYKEPLFGISFINDKIGWVVGYGGTIIRTYDGGRSWIEQESGTKTDLFAVAFYKNLGFAIGRDGLLLRYYERR
jgi:photosystem II stability/assembly factor-like uncharacterized protein